MASFPHFFTRVLDPRLLSGLLTLVLLLLRQQLPAQYFTETFDNVATLASNDWVQLNRSTPSGGTPNWFQGDAGYFPALDGNDTAYIAANYNCIAGAGTISNWLLTPTCTFTNGERISFWTRTVNQPNYPDRLQVRLSLNGNSTNVGTSNSSVGDFSTLMLQVNPTLTRSGYPNTWTQYTLIISGLTAPTAGRIGFRYFVGNGGPGGANSEYIGIDSVAYYMPPAGDLMLLKTKPLEYAIFPERHPFAGPYEGILRNEGSNTVSGGYMEVRITDGGGSLVFTSNSNLAANLAPGESDTVTAAVPSSLPVGDYRVTYIVHHGSGDPVAANDSLHEDFSIAPLLYARNRGPAVSSVGIGGAYDGGLVGTQFVLRQPDNLDSVWLHVQGGYTGRPLAAQVWHMSGGIPSTLLGTTDTLTYTTAGAADYSLAMHGGPLQLPAGEFLIAMVELDSTVQLGLSEDIYTPERLWLYIPTHNGGNWRVVEDFALPEYRHTAMIRAILATCDLTASAVATPPSSPGAQDGSATVTPAGGTPPYAYSWSSGATTATATGLGGTAVTVTVTDAAGCVSTLAVSLLVGVEQGLENAGLLLYPNPAQSTLVLQLRSGVWEEGNIVLRTMLGQQLRNIPVSAGDPALRAIDVSALPAGSYMLTVPGHGAQRFWILR